MCEKTLKHQDIPVVDTIQQIDFLAKSLLLTTDYNTWQFLHYAIEWNCSIHINFVFIAGFRDDKIRTMKL